MASVPALRLEPLGGQKLLKHHDFHVEMSHVGISMSFHVFSLTLFTPFVFLALEKITQHPIWGRWTVPSPMRPSKAKSCIAWVGNFGPAAASPNSPATCCWSNGAASSTSVKTNHGETKKETRLVWLDVIGLVGSNSFFYSFELRKNYDLELVKVRESWLVF